MSDAETLADAVPEPGDILRLEDFGRGETGVLRLAALPVEGATP